MLQPTGLWRNSFAFAFLLNLLSNNTFSDLKIPKKATKTNPGRAQNYSSSPLHSAVLPAHS